ncbi:hypothetical protein [Rhizobium laguerreae]|uniref:hypothetical protein n=1 Tax=Rhizobium laguerreae TaxID=1076926 RepID=UPI001C92ABBB|nr:hypothetical protein [Rhizobium laguerreae]MBY3038941.1 hypothetical protein [Rhizobium laguerreae]
MTISSETNRSGPYPGNGVTTAFEYQFKILEPEHLQVIKTDASGVDTILVLDTDYTVNGVGDDGGGQAVVAPAPAMGTKITLLLNVPFTQDTDLENQGAYYAETVERAFDLMVMRLQQLKERSARAVTIPPTYDSATIDQLIANVLALGDKGAAIEAVAAVAQYLETVADVADDIPAVAGLTATTVTKAGEAAQSASDASGSAALSAAYANNGEDIVIPGSGGLFSAKHFMLKSKAIFDSLTNTIAGWIHAAAAKTTLNDDDEIGIADSATAWVLKKISLFNLVRYIASITGQVKISGCETVYVSTTTIQMKTGYVFFNGRRTTFGAALTKALNATFVAGAAGGMLDTGVMQASKTYFIHAVRNVATGAGDWVASLQYDPALVNMTNLTGWTVEGRVNVVLTTSGNVIRQYTQDGNDYRSANNLTEVTSSTITMADWQLVQIPVGISTEANLMMIVGANSNSSGSLSAWTDFTSGPGTMHLSVNVVSPVEMRTTGKVRTRAGSGVIRLTSSTAVGTMTYTLQSIGFNDYTVPRMNGATA